MNWAGAIERNSEALKGIIAALFAMLEQAVGVMGSAPSPPRPCSSCRGPPNPPSGASLPPAPRARWMGARSIFRSSREEGHDNRRVKHQRPRYERGLVTIRRITLPGLDTSVYPYSHLVTDGSYAYLSGVVAADVPGGASALGDVAEETRVVMTAIRDALAHIGLGTDRIVRVDIHMTDLDRMSELNPVYASFFPEGALPTRTCTEAGRLVDDSNVEITVIAKLP